MSDTEGRAERVVMKFGGTSMGTAAAMRGAAAIVRAHRGETVVVVSATSGTTDALIRLGRTALAGGDWRAVLDAILSRHATLASELGMSGGLSSFWTEIDRACQGVEMLRELSPATLDLLQSFGERVSATIFAAHLNAVGVRTEMVDASRLIVTDGQFGAANVDFPSTNPRTADVLSPLIASGVVPVVTGFIGQFTADNKYTTLGRGGSDYSAAIVAAAMDATELQIWTDVDGMFTADPRVIPSATVVDQLSYAEAEELAGFGAKVLHPKTIRPAIEKGIPVRILNTFNPAAPGTLIDTTERPSIKSVTSKRGATVVNVRSLDMFGAHGFLARTFDVFARHKLVVDVLSSSVVTVSATIDGDIPSGFLDELRVFSSVEIERGMATVSVVGEGIRTQRGVLRGLADAMDPIPVSMVSQGASPRTITFVVAESDMRRAVDLIFRKFFTS